MASIYFPPFHVMVSKEPSDVPGYDAFVVTLTTSSEQGATYFDVYHEKGPAGPYYLQALAQEILSDLTETAKDPQYIQKKEDWYREDAPEKVKEAAATYREQVTLNAPLLAGDLQDNNGRGVLDLSAWLLEEDRDPATSISNAKILLYRYGIPDAIRLEQQGANFHVLADWEEAAMMHDFRGFKWGLVAPGDQELYYFFGWLGMVPRFRLMGIQSLSIARGQPWKWGRKSWSPLPMGRPRGRAFLKGVHYGLER